MSSLAGQACSSATKNEAASERRHSEIAFATRKRRKDHRRCRPLTKLLVVYSLLDPLLLLSLQLLHKYPDSFLL
jgi:hypothetical protein